MNLIIIIIVIVLLFGGGGVYGVHGGYYGPAWGGGIGIIGLLIVLWLLFNW